MLDDILKMMDKRRLDVCSVARDDDQRHKLFSSIRKGETMLKVTHKELDDMDTKQLKNYLAVLRARCAAGSGVDTRKTTLTDKSGPGNKRRLVAVDDLKQKKKRDASRRVEIGKAILFDEGEIPDKLPLANAVKRIQIALKCDWYYPRYPFELAGEQVTDFRSKAKELLSNATDASYTDRIVELAETIPPLRVASKRIEDQLDHRIVSWRKFSEDSLCAIYWHAMKDRKPEVYAPLGKYLGFYH